MQYILTEEEYKDLIEKGKYDKKNMDIIQTLCIMVANQTIGCPIDCRYEYNVCDDCPVQDYCPWPHKEFSK